MSRSHCSVDHRRAKTEFKLSGNKSNQKLKSEKYFQIYSNLLNPERLMTTESSTGTIGPGYYNYSSTSLGGPACTFASTQRFTFTYSGLASPIIRDSSNFKSKNMNLEQFTPQNKKDLLKIKAMNEQNRIQRTLQTKTKLTKEKRKEKLKKLEEKHNKFRMKIQYIEVHRCANTWLALSAFITFANSSFNKLLYLKDLHRRSFKHLKFLRLFCRFLGKIKISLRKKKVARALNILSKFAVVVKRWAKVRRAKYLGIINDIIYKAAGKEKIFRFMYQWRTSLTFIQRVWKKSVVEKKVAMALRLMYWEKNEKTMFESQVSIKNGIKAKFQSYIPQNLKEKLIKELLKKRIRDYCRKWVKYRENIQSEFVRQKDGKGPGAKRNNIVMNVEKPQPNYHFTKKDYLKLIRQASLMRKNSKVLIKVPTFR